MKNRGFVFGFNNDIIEFYGGCRKQCVAVGLWSFLKKRKHNKSVNADRFKRGLAVISLCSILSQPIHA